MNAIAYLIRESRGGVTTIMCGKMFKSRKAAKAAAERLTNRWRTCTVVPVKETHASDRLPANSAFDSKFRPGDRVRFTEAMAVEGIREGIIYEINSCDIYVNVEIGEGQVVTAHRYVNEMEKISGA